MGQKLLNPWALDENGKPVRVEHAKKGGKYTCPECHDPLIYRRESVGKKRNVCAYFRHSADNSNCHGSQESYIHRIAKEEIHHILKQYIENKRDFPIIWTCPNCKQKSTGNLLCKAVSVQKEKAYCDKDDKTKKSRPDVSLVDSTGNLIVAIEVINTHDVEQPTFVFYENHDVALVKIYVHSEEDCKNIESLLHHPNSVNVCFNRNCLLSQTMPMQRTIIPINCYGKWCLCVGVSHPFDANAFIGLPFNEKDKQKAEQFIKTNGVNVSIVYKMDKNGYNFGALEPIKFTKQLNPSRPHVINPYGTGMDKLIAERKFAKMNKQRKIQQLKKSGKKRRF